MYLKSIEVYGFKSFANKIIFKFNDGITGIVGPNGSGKSNVADAVRWVLGEQSAKQLRGAKMEDVIFSGTETRKPQGSAYVALTIDNSDKSLPIDYNEVTVARRVYRSGESEYLINGVVSRLKDVNHLFFDTGIGKEGYSIIGQGQVEKIISGKPEERRELFDEAAGIVKYKKNKAATEKSLEKERADLERVTDILNELEKQVGPLKSQSETAKKYILFKEELKKLDINAFLLDEQSNKDEMKDIENKLQIIDEDMLRLKEESDKVKEEYERIENALNEYSEKIDEAKNDITEKKLTNQRLEGDINLITEQIASYDKSKGALLEQQKRATEELEERKKLLAAEYEKKALLDEKLDNADEVLETAKKEYEDLKNQIEAATNEIEDSKALIIETLNEGGSLKAKVGRYDTMLENINLRKIEINKKLLENKAEEQKLIEEEKNLDNENSEIETLLNSLTDEATKINTALEMNLEAKNKAKADIAESNNQIVSLRSKYEALRNLTERYDGYGNSIRRVMEQKASNPGIRGVVADIIEVDKRYETAIETALGGSIQNIVTTDDSTAKKMIRFLKENKYGRATFLPIGNIVLRGDINRDAVKEDGVVAVASDLVKCDKEYDTLIKHLLGRILVVSDIDKATLIAKKYKQSLRIVTIEGEQINPGGAMTGGAFKNSSNLLGRKRELDEITEKIEEYKKLLVEATSKNESLDEQRNTLKESLEKVNASINETNIRKNTFDLTKDAHTRRKVEASRQFDNITRENTEIAKQIEDIERNKEELLTDNKKQEEEVKRLEARIEELTKSNEKSKLELDKKQEKIGTLSVDFNLVNQQYEFSMQTITRINDEKKKFTAELEELDRKINGGDNEKSMLLNNINNVRNTLEENKRIIGIKEQKLAEYVDEREKLSASNKDFFKKREELNEQINGLDKSAFKLNSSIEKISEKSENLNNYMWEEYELTFNAAAEFRDESLDDAVSLKREITAVKAKIKALGDVNVNAIEEYKSVSERYEFLKGQHDDIVKAEESLVKIINELDVLMKEQFAEKFKDIRIMFSQVFKELFGGGKADLELVDEEDLLETGIKIIAQPPGKKLQNMNMLSGGEKSLTAISLLFAIQSLKPSPFCLLDEIEAALDDSNVKRFAKYLEKLTKDTQFIVITHRKGTMEQADILYGITMQEKGVSTLVSVNMIENDLDE